MASVLDRALLSILKNKDEQTLLRINTEWLDAKELIRYRYVTDYYKENSELVSVRDFCAKFAVDRSEGESKPSLYIRELKDRYLFAEISEVIPNIIKKARSKTDSRALLDELTELVSKLNSEEVISKEYLYSDRAIDRLEEYDERVRTGGITYMSYGNAVLDKLYHGLRKTDLVTFGGKAGSKKTWLLCYLAVIMEAVLPEELGDLLFVTNEVPATEIEERIDCIRFYLPYGKFLDGTLSRTERRRYVRGVDEMETSRIRIIENCTSLEELRFKVKLYSPSACLLDGSYLMEGRSTRPEWEKITLITRGLKVITNNDKCPILNTTQLKGGGGKKEKGLATDAQDEFAYSKSYAADSDLAVMMFAEKEMIFRHEVGMQTAKGRRAKPGVTPLFLCDLTEMKLDFMMPTEEDEFTPPDTAISF